MSIPLSNEGLQPFCQGLLVLEIGDFQALALKDTKPLFHLIHPGAMHGWKVKDKGMFG